MPRTAKQLEQLAAKKSRRLCEARISGLKLRAKLEPPRAAVGKFPYQHRTCAEWKELPSGVIVDRELTASERRKDAKEGSARLRDAILMHAA